MKAPNFDDFKDYGQNAIAMAKDNPENYTEWLLFKYMAWDASDWHKCVKGKEIPIKNWKTTLLQCLPYREPNKANKTKFGQSLSATQKLKIKHGI